MLSSCLRLIGTISVIRTTQSHTPFPVHWTDGDSFARIRTAVVVQGFNLQADDWEHVVMGSIENQKLGRIPHAVLVAHRERASLAIFGSGASAVNGRKEGAFTLEYMLDNFNRLIAFDSIRDLGLNLLSLRARMEAISICETESLDTFEELEEACALLSRTDVEKVILISSATNMPRCLRDAVTVFSRRNYFPIIIASPCGSDVYCLPPRNGDGSQGPAAVCIIEPSPPYQGGEPISTPTPEDDDQSSLSSSSSSSSSLHLLASRALKVSQEDHQRQAFLADFETLLQRYDGKSGTTTQARLEGHPVNPALGEEPLREPVNHSGPSPEDEAVEMEPLSEPLSEPPPPLGSSWLLLGEIIAVCGMNCYKKRAALREIIAVCGVLSASRQLREPPSAAKKKGGDDERNMS
eukprot:CAMPEP_0185753368 /NCGR_PEP_ID=MMETSP1174-20130828/12073_1 /TAXON_ID=35687 /ORGANISM="Dictyocha speculum, Strain CCMP1381" /LENGTH=407 /DNA_ID=CAMNT_0028431165 /DNA_START=16 /DNA_END=1240 /DNA_ORIENTATION=+